MSATLERLIEVGAYNLYGACLTGSPTPRQKEMYDRIREPRVGDLVLETTTMGRAMFDGNRLGRLARIAREPVYTAEEWQEGGGGDDPIPLETVHYLTLRDGREFRWTNASFIAVLTECESFFAPLVSDPTAFLAAPSPAPEANRP